MAVEVVRDSESSSFAPCAHVTGPPLFGTSASAIDSAAGGTQGVNKQHIAAAVVVVLFSLQLYPLPHALGWPVPSVFVDFWIFQLFCICTNLKLHELCAGRLFLLACPMTLITVRPELLAR